MAEVRCAVGNFVCDLHIDLNTCLMSNCRQMQHGIGGASQRHIHSQSVHKSVLGHDVAGTDIFFNKFHNLHAGVLGKADTGGVDGGDCAVALKAHADGLGQAVHGVCSVHAGAGTAGGTDLLLIFAELLFCHGACGDGADCFKNRGKTALSAVDAAGHHGTAGDKDSGNVDPCCCHQQSGDVFVAVGDHDEAVKAVGLCHALGGIRDQVTGDQRILHSDMAHGDTVADCDRGEHDGHTACHGDTHLDSLGDLVQVHVAGNDLIIGTDDTDHGTSSLFLCVAESIEQTPVGSCGDTFFDRITLHDITSILENTSH